MAIQTQEKNKESKMPGTTTVILVVGLLCMVAVLIYSAVKSGNVYTSYSLEQTLSRGDNTSVYYQIMQKGMLRYSSDGAAMTDKSGNLLWNQTYQMSSPAIAAGDDYAAIADIDSNDIYVFDGSGEVSHIVTDVPIQDLEIADQGVVAAILSDTTSNYINLYDKSGNALVSIKATLENTGYPIAMALSPDATGLTVSYLVIGSGAVQTQAVFYNFSDSGSDYVTGTLVLDGLYPKLDYLDRTRVVLYGEQCFRLYQVGGSEISEVRTVEFEDDIRSVFSGNQKIGFIFKNNDDQGSYRLEIYDLAGQMNSTIYTDFEYYKVVSGSDEIILYDDHEIMIYEYDGHAKFVCDMNQFFTDVMASWQTNSYWVISDQYLQEISLE